MLEKYGLANANTVAIPEDTSVKLDKNDGVSKFLSATTKYQPMVGALLYTAMATRLHIAHAVGVLGKFNSKPTITSRILLQPSVYFVTLKEQPIMAFQFEGGVDDKTIGIFRCRLGW